MNSFFAYLARLKLIRRWGLMQSVWPENDAEHTLQTVTIAHALAVIRRDVFHVPCNVERCAMLAVYHDASEVFTGDLPTPVKYFNPALHGEYEKIEMMARERLFRTLSAYLKCVEELRAGNHEFKKAHDEIKKKIEDMHCREAEWFLNRFARSFTLTLDEME